MVSAMRVSCTSLLASAAGSLNIAPVCGPQSGKACSLHNSLHSVSAVFRAAGLSGIPSAPTTLILRRKPHGRSGRAVANESTVRRGSCVVTAQAKAGDIVSPADDKDVQSSIYANPGWVWQFPVKKEKNPEILPKLKAGSLELQFWLLVNVALHYFTLVSQSLVAYTLFAHQDVFIKVTAGQTGLFAVILSEIFLGAAGLGPVLMHEYEGWLIAPYVYPVDDDARKACVEVEPVNNDRWLRNTAFRSLFILQTVGLSLMSCGIPFLPVNVTWTIWAVIWVFLLVAPRNPLIPISFSGRDVLPVTPYVIIPFILGALCYTEAFSKVTGSVFFAFSTALLNAVAGAWFEGVKAESTFDQRWHTAAAFTLGAVGLVKVWYLREHAVSGYVLHAGWGLWAAFIVAMAALIYFSFPRSLKKGV